MYLIENPVLQRELLVNLRMTWAFVLLFLYQALLGVVVFFAWPDEEQLNLSGAGSGFACDSAGIVAASAWSVQSWKCILVSIVTVR